MKDEEKNLIENLFHRLKKIELNCSERDDTADVLIQNLVKKQPYSSYYMVQTILIQETAIKKMNLKIEELKNQISILNSDQVNKKPSFLSNFLKKDPRSKTISYDNNIWKKNQNNLESCNTNIPSSSAATTRNSGFLKNALQTATGVAGGMILGNMLMNLFNHTTPEEEIFDNINQSSASDIDHEYDSIQNNHSNLVNYENQNEPLENYSDDNNFSNFDETEHVDDSEMNDDNFI